MKKLVSILLFVSFCSILNAQKLQFNKRMSALSTGSLVPVQVGDNEDVTSPGDTGSYIDTEVKDFVTLGIDHSYPNVESDSFTLEVDVIISPLEPLLSSYTITLEIEYHPFSKGNYQDRDSYLFTDITEYNYEIDEIRINSSTNTYLPNNVYLDGNIDLRRYYDFTTSLDSVSVNGSSLSNLDCDYNDVDDQIEISWNTVPGAFEYQLEWTFVNNIAATVTADTIIEDTIAAGNLEYNFRNNSTRITTTATNYELPLLFDQGFLIYRVRSVGEKPSEPGKYIYGDWGVLNSGFVQDVIDSYSNHAILLEGHDQRKNWQVTTTFAEEGKKKEVVSYYDGSLRNRQSVTKVNTDNNVIVGETIYDYQGRPAVNVLPVPVQDDSCGNDNPNPIRFYPNFNRNGSENGYGREDFNLDVTDCETAIDSMSKYYGASRYYSEYNLKKEDEQSYVPNAEGFPFTIVEYTPDNTGRIRRQSGVGQEFSLGSGHESKYFYGKPDQIQLDRLFGSEVGYAKHYKKNMVIDPNGQISVSYLDQEGRVIATSLSGEAPSNLDTLESYNDALVTLLDNMITADKENTTSSGNVNQIELRQSLLVGTADEYLFTYNLSTDNFQDECLAADICFSCIYDLTISLVDDCGNPIVASNGDTIQFTIQQGHMDSVGIDSVVFTTDCDIELYEYEYQFSALLSVGNYNLVKTLTLNQSAQDYYLEAYLDTVNNECVLSYDYFLDSYLADIDTMNCYLDCDACVASLGLRDDFIAQQKGTGAQYDALLEDCLDDCEEPTACEMSYEMMLGDFAPGGQYGEYIDPSGSINPLSHHLSIYNPLNYLPNSSASWRNPSILYNGQSAEHYLNGDGTVAYLHVELINGVYTPEVINSSYLHTINGELYVEPHHLQNLSDFVLNWDENWSKSLVIYHPEYCYYEECVQFEIENSNGVSSESFDSELRASNFSTAVANGWLEEDVMNPGTFILNLTNFDDPFLDNTYSAYDPYSHFVLDGFLTGTYKSIGSTDMNLLETAAVMNNCGTSAVGAYSITSSCLLFGGDSLKKDISWNTFVGLYLSEKMILVNNLYDLSASTGSCLNDCIGADTYNPYSSGNVTTSPFSNSFFTAWMNSNEPCSHNTWYYYKNKQKRFMDQGDLVYDPDEIEATIYSATGQNSTANNFQYLLDEIVQSGNLTSSSDTLSAYSYFPGFYQSTVESEVIYSIPTSFHYVVSQTDTTLDINMVIAEDTCTLSLYTDGVVIDWDSIVSMGSLVMGDVLGDDSYSFSITGLEVQDTVSQSVTIYGITCYDVANIEIATNCQPTDFLYDINLLFSIMAGEGLFTGDYNLGEDEDFEPFLSDHINLYLNEDTTIQYYYTADSVWLESEEGEVIFDFISLDFESGQTMDSVVYFANISNVVGNQYEVIGYNAQGNISVSMEVEVIYIESFGDTIDLEVAICNSSEPATCNWQAYQNMLDLEAFIGDIFAGGNINESPYYTDNLAQYFEEDLFSYMIDTSGVLVFITEDSSVSNCDFKFYPESGNFYDILDTIDIVGLIDARPIGDVFNNAFYNYEFDVLIEIGEGDTVEYDTINFYGSGCIPVDLCSICDSMPCPPDSIVDLSQIEQVTVPYVNPCVENMLNLAAANAANAYENYIDSLSYDFVQNYRNHCIDSLNESFTKQYDLNEYHYTLYYYDQAGNLIKTIPPEGVSLLELDTINDPDGALTKQIAADRLNKEQTVFTDHRLATKYVYNSLNQLVKQNLPDHDQMDIWEHRLMSGLDQEFKVRDIHFINESEGYQVGLTSYDGYSQGRMYKTTNGGENWSEIYGLISEDINQLFYYNTDTIIAVGDKGTMLISVNNGATMWNSILLYADNIKQDIYDIHLNSDGLGLLVGDSGLVASCDFYNDDYRIINTTCLTCPSASFELSQNDLISSVEYNGSDYFISVQKTIDSNSVGFTYKSSDGIDWELISNVRLEEANNLSVIDNNNFKVVGNNGLFVSTSDGGQNWFTVATDLYGDFTDIEFSDSLVGVAIVDETLYSTINGGVNWSVLDSTRNYQTINLTDTASDFTYGFAGCSNGEVIRVLIQDGYAPFIDPSTISPSFTNDISNVWSVKSGNKFYAIAAYNNHQIKFTEDFTESGGAIWSTINTYIAGGVKDLRFILNSGDLKGYFLANGGKLYPFTYDISTSSLMLGATTTRRYSSIDLDETTNLIAYDYINNELETFSIASGTSTATDLSGYIGATTNAVIGGCLSGAKMLIDKEGTILNLDPTIEDQTYHIRPLQINDLEINDSVFVAVTNHGKFIIYEDTIGTYHTSNSLNNLNAVEYLDSSKVAIGGNQGVLFTFENNNISIIDGNTSENINDISFENGSGVVIAGDNGLKSYASNIDDNYTPVSSNDISNFNAALIYSYGRTVFSGDNASFLSGYGANVMKTKRVYPRAITAVDFENSLHGAISAGGFCIRVTEDGANSFQTVLSQDDFVGRTPTIFDIEVIEDKIFIVGDSLYLGKIKNNWAVKQSMSGYPNGQLRDISIIRDTGYIVGGKSNYGEYWTSFDGGESWSSHYAIGTTHMRQIALFHFEHNQSFISVGQNGNAFRYYNGNIIELDIPGASGLMDVSFYDDQNGYAIDSRGKIYKTSNVSWNNPQDRVITGLDWESKNVDEYFNEQTVPTDVIGQAIEVIDKNHLIIGGHYNNGYTNFSRKIYDESDEFSTRFFYDKLGRIVVSQNSRQKEKNPERFSYTKYDELGRVVEAGVKNENSSEDYLQFNVDYIDLGHNDRCYTNQVTLEAWVRSEHTSSEHYIVSKKEFYSSQDHFSLGFYNGKLRLKMNDGTTTHSLIGSALVCDGLWHHVAGVIDSSHLEIFVDGELDGTYDATSFTYNLGGSPSTLYLGRYPSGTSSCFVGDMKSFRIWESPRSQFEIRSNMNETLTGQESNLVGLFDLNEGSGSQVTDRSSLGIHGTFGTASFAPSWSNPSSPSFKDIFGSEVSDYYNPNVIDDEKLLTWINDSTGARREVTHSYYDTINSAFDLPGSFVQNEDNLRKRIGSVVYEELYDGNDSTYNYATHYDYDIHGNVKTLLQDNKDLGNNANPDVALMQFKRMDYEYDLISGNVHHVIYQPDSVDQWHHKYEYDGDNRIQTVSTSDDGLNWEEDVRYFYYDHGPLARVELGENNVQGVDYAYTLQGWLKGVNSDLITPTNDIGKDGLVDLPQDTVYHLEFDGAYDRIDCTNDNRDLDYDMTIGAWFRTTSSGRRNILTKRITGGAWALALDYGKAYLYMSYSGGGKSLTGTSTNLNDGEWHYISAVVDSSDMKIYVDGILENQTTHQAGPDVKLGSGIYANQIMYIGHNPGYDVHNFTGDLKEVRIFNEARSEVQNYADFNAVSVNESDPSLVGYFKLNEGTGTSSEDLSYIGEDATLLSNPVWAYEVSSPSGISDPNPNQFVARDAFGFSLNYFTGDYTAINPGVSSLGRSFNSSISGSDVASNTNDLYNGNIGSMVTSIKQPKLYSATQALLPTIHPQATAYQYDQLNRLKEAKAFTNVEDDITNSNYNVWANDGTYDGRYYNHFIYDANGNIQMQERMDALGNQIDSLTYNYALDGNGEKVQNRLYSVNDIVNYDAADIDDMGTFISALDSVNDGSNNYMYDATGQLIQDKQEEIAEIVWRVDGKIKAIVRDDASSKTNLVFDYDPMGNRIAKHIYGNSTTPFDYTDPTDWQKSTYYNRDAQGNVIAVYEYQVDTAASETHFTLAERNIYGSSRVGMNVEEVEMIAATSTTDHAYGAVGLRQYELSNHLGNVLSVITDRKFAIDTDEDETIDYYEPDVLKTFDYSPFGVILPERSFEKKDIYTNLPDTVNYLLFDETDNNVTIGNVLVDGYSEITVEAWIRPDSLPTNASPDGHNSNEGAIVHKCGTGDDNLGLTVASGGLSFYLDLGSDYTLTVPAPALNQWSHIAAVYDGAKMKIYVNGDIIDSLSATGNIISNGNNLRIGGKHVVSTFEFIGGIRDVRIWDKAKDVNSIRSEMNFELTGTEDGLTGAWLLDEGLGSSLEDLKGNNDGSFNGTYSPEWSTCLVDDIISIPNEIVYRYGMNGMERDDEVKGAGNSYTTMFRQYDPRIGRWLTLDPKMSKYPELSPYIAFNNNPVYFTDPLGDDPPEDKKIGDYSEVAVGEASTLVAEIISSGIDYKDKGAITDFLKSNEKALEMGETWDEETIDEIEDAMNSIILNLKKLSTKKMNGVNLAEFMHEMYKTPDLAPSDLVSLAYKSEELISQHLGYAIQSYFDPEIVGTMLFMSLGTGGGWANTSQTLRQSGYKFITTRFGSDVAGKIVGYYERLSGVAKSVSTQKQARHVFGTARDGAGYVNSMGDATKILDAIHSGNATYLGKTNAGHLVYRVEEVVGTNVNLGNGIRNQSTNVFILKGTKSPSIVPTTPFWTP